MNEVEAEVMAESLTGTESVSSRMVKHRPTSVTATSLLAIVIGALGAVGGAILIPGAGTILATLSISAVFIGVLYIAVGYGLLRGRRWAWASSIIVSTLALARNIAEAATGSVAFAIPGIVIAVVVVYLVTRPTAATFLGRKYVARSKWLLG